MRKSTKHDYAAGGLAVGIDAGFGLLAKLDLTVGLLLLGSVVFGALALRVVVGLLAAIFK